MELSKRLRAVAALVTPGNIVADIGCDHGYVSIYLVETKTAPRAIAMDVNRGPLEKAKEHIALHSLSEYIDTRLSDGAAELQEGEADSLICAGMGGRLIIKILTNSREKLYSIKELILQPQSEIGQVRRFLREEGYSILSENMIAEDGKIYPMIKAALKPDRVTEPAEPEYQVIWDQYGRWLLENKNTVLFEFLNQELKICNRILSKLKKVTPESKRQHLRCMEMEVKIAEIDQALGYFS